MRKPRIPRSAKQVPRTESGRQAFSLVSSRRESQGALDEQRMVQSLIDLLKENNLTELELEREGLRIRLRRESPASVLSSPARDSASTAPEISAQGQPASVPGETSRFITVTSPIVGTFYRSPSPDADPYVEEGDVVKKGQVLCIVEAMKLMNEIESEVDGRIVKILAESTKPVEYGQPLFLIDPSPSS